MSYWGKNPEDSDFAFGSVGVAILRIKNKMLEDIKVVSEDKYPEHSVYQGMGSFSDQVPYKYDTESKSLIAITGTEGFDNYATKVYELSLELRVVGRY